MTHPNTQPGEGKDIIHKLPKGIYPVLSEAFADNGEHSHWRLIDANTGDLLWTEAPEEDKLLYTGYSPQSDHTAPQGEETQEKLWAEAIDLIEVFADGVSDIHQDAVRILQGHFKLVRTTSPAGSPVE